METNIKREVIKIPESKWCDLVHELYLTDDNGEEIEIEEIERSYRGSGRHTEHHSLIFKRVTDNKFFKVRYESSVKDSMGWDECNCGDTEAIQVFPEEKVIVVYK